jgi:hypothetical protein
MAASKSATKSATKDKAETRPAGTKASTSDKMSAADAAKANETTAGEDVQKVQIVPPGPESGEIAPTGTEESVPDKTSLNSAVTSDLKNETDVVAESEEAQAAADEDQAKDKSVEARASRAGIGLVKVDGIDFRYVGVAPARMGGRAETPTGMRITPENSTFTPLSMVPFHPSIRCQAENGQYYFPQDGVTNWDGVELDGQKLVPTE